MESRPLRWYEALLAVACFYAYGRLLWFVIQRRRYNRTHNSRVFLVSMWDIPHFFFEFFCLPILAVRWLMRRRLSGKKQ